MVISSVELDSFDAYPMNRTFGDFKMYINFLTKKPGGY